MLTDEPGSIHVQGMEWCDKSLLQDDDGDTAHEFLGPFSFNEKYGRAALLNQAEAEAADSSSADDVSAGVLGCESAESKKTQ